MSKYVSVIGGLISVLLGLIGIIKWWDLFSKAFLATLPVVLVFGGLIALAAGISELKDGTKSKEAEKK